MKNKTTGTPIQPTSLRTLYYVGLESYQARYTLQLTDWNVEVFRRRGIQHHLVNGQQLTQDEQIHTGQVLDAHGRSYWALSQCMELVKLMQSGKVTNEDVIFFEDLFHPGIEAISYITSQSPPHLIPRVYVRCLAQTIDPDDFVNSTGMAPWMRRYEQMVCETVAGVLCSSEEMIAHARIAGWKVPLYVTGLPFGKQEVQSRVPFRKPLRFRKRRVVFAARWDIEKQPEFYMDLIERWNKEVDTGTEFVLLSGGKLRSNAPELVERARQLAARGMLTIHENLKKNEYYALLADSQLLFNCALQDWVSNTVSEADALGTLVLYPAYRSFPEAFANDPARLYLPWSQEDAMLKMRVLLKELPAHTIGAISDWQDGTIDRTLDVLEGKGTHLERSGLDYRKHVAIPKYPLESHQLRLAA